MPRKIRLPSPALAVALVALFVALSGTAVAAGVVPLAKRALLADNAKKLGGKTPAALLQQAAAGAKQMADQAAQQPGPASTAAGLVSQKSSSGQVPAGGLGSLSVSCDTGQKALGGGWSASGLVLNLGMQPMGEGAWTFAFVNLGESTPANVSVYTSCMK